MNETILITGAGSGIGRATAVLFAERGWDIVLLGRNEEQLHETALLLDGNVQYSICTADVGSSEQMSRALARSGIEFLNAVFCSAGISKENAYGEDDLWDSILDINLKGSYNTFYEALPYLRKSSSAYRSVVFTSSVVARFGVPYHNAYSAAKAGILGLTRSLAAEYASEKLLINAICPGWVDTDMAKESIERLARRSGRDYHQERDFQMSLLPLGTMAPPQDIAETVYFLAGGVQSSITGQALDINSGAYFAPLNAYTQSHNTN